MKFVHTNLVARDWRKLADFYISIFNCTPVPPEGELKGEWLDKAVNLEDTHIQGVHLRLPGYVDGPILEVFQYRQMEAAEKPNPNTPGFGHLAFRVPDVEETAKKIVKMGGSYVRELTSVEINGVGSLIFAYMRDPEGNIIEIQRYS
jgi:predicted enzyme related to lactoylglutathione lyase